MHSSLIPAVAALVLVGSALVFLAPADSTEVTPSAQPSAPSRVSTPGSNLKTVPRTQAQTKPPADAKAPAKPASASSGAKAPRSEPTPETTAQLATPSPSHDANRIREAALQAAERRLSAGASQPRIENGKVIIDNHPVRVAMGDGRIMVIPARVVATPNKKTITTPSALRAASRRSRK